MKSHPKIIKVGNNRLTVLSGRVENTPVWSHETIRPTRYPIIKWAGGKQWLAGAAKFLIPPNWNGRYYEPFVGGGAFFFALEPDWASLSDRNEELIITYRAISTDPDSVIKNLIQYPHTKEFYYYLRARKPRAQHTIAARFIYLNRTCWNGLYRVNEQGKFNTPFGNIINPTICDKDRICSASRALKKTRLNTVDFGQAISKAKLNDFIYLDPPYITGHKNNGFLRYNSKLFSWEDQKRLATWAIHLAEKGVHLLISNADHPSVVNLYKGFLYYQSPRRNEIAGKVNARGIVTEALLSTYPLLGYESTVI